MSCAQLFSFKQEVFYKSSLNVSAAACGLVRKGLVSFWKKDKRKKVGLTKHSADSAWLHQFVRKDALKRRCHTRIWGL
jgi:hypothetical protein